MYPYSRSRSRGSILRFHRKNAQRSLTHLSPALPIVLIALIFLPGCIPESPEAPSWDITLTVPVFDNAVDMKEEIEQEMGEGGILYVDTTYAEPVVGFTVSGEIDSVFPLRDMEFENFENPEEIFFLSDYAASFSDSARSVGFSFPRVWPPSRFLHDRETLIPSFEIEPADPLVDTLPPFDAFEYIDVESGDLRLEIVNGLPVDIENVHVVASGGGHEVANIAFPGIIEAGSGSAAQTVPLDGRHITRELEVRIDLSSPGSDLKRVEVDTNRAVTATAVLLPPLYLTEGSLQSEGVVLRRNFSADFRSDSIRIDEMRFSGGGIGYEVNNGFDTDLLCDLLFQDFVDSLDAPLQGWMLLTSSTPRQEFFFPLDDVTYIPHESAPGTLHTFHTDLTASPPGTGDYFLARDDQSLDFLLTVSDLEVEQFTGRSYERVGTDTTVARLDLPPGMPEVEFSHEELLLTVDNTAAMPMDVDLVLESVETDGQVMATFERTISVPAGSKAHTTVFSDDPDLLELLNHMPDRITTFGEVEMFDGTIDFDDYVYASYRFSTPLIFVMAESRYEHDPPDSLGIDEDTREDIYEHVGGGKIHMTIENHFPLGMSAFINFAHDPAKVYSDPDVSLPVSMIESGAIGEDGWVIAASTARDTLTIGKDDIEIMFSHLPLYAGFALDFPGSGGEEIVVREEDYIRINGFIQMTVRIGDGD